MLRILPEFSEDEEEALDPTVKQEDVQGPTDAAEPTSAELRATSMVNSDHSSPSGEPLDGTRKSQSNASPSPDHRATTEAPSVEAATYAERYASQRALVGPSVNPPVQVPKRPLLPSEDEEEGGGEDDADEDVGADDGDAVTLVGAIAKVRQDVGPARQRPLEKDELERKKVASNRRKLALKQRESELQRGDMAARQSTE